MSATELYNVFLASAGVSIDTRKLQGGEIFFALKGENFDGNEYVDIALSKGCKHVVCEDEKYAGNEKVSVVDSSLRTLQELAGLHRKETGVKIVAVTGSNGKTTTKELLARVLASGYKVLATRGNLNNHIGVPLTLLSLRDEEFAVIEMGANHPGEIAVLCEIADPDFGLITNIGKAHLEGFGDINGVRKAKGELYDYLARKGGLAFVNTQENYLEDMASLRGVNMFTYGESGMFYGACIKASPAIEASFDYDGKVYTLHSVLFGEYNFRNIMSALAVGYYFGIEPALLTEAIETFVPDNNRSQLVRGKTNVLILDAYNANPSSMQLAITEFAARKEGKKMLVLGEMMELGTESYDEHKAILKRLDESNFDKVVLVGEQFRVHSERFPAFDFFRTIDDYIDSLIQGGPSGYLIMLKGSRKNALEKATKLLLSC